MNETVGTIYTMAPEVLNGNYDEKCDCWSIGILAFMLLRQPTYMTEEITVLKSYDVAGVMHVDSTVVIRTNLSEDELPSISRQSPAHMDSTIEVFKYRDLP